MMHCTTQNSVQPELVSPLVVAAHDAGATNLIIGWLRRRRDLEVRTCLDGPAVDLWATAFGKPLLVSPTDALRGAAGLLSGTSFASDLEHKARALAKEHGIHSIGVIDHWVNYVERFLRAGSRVLPNEIWVADEDALTTAAACFPGIAIRQQPNFYLADLVAQVRKNERKITSTAVRRVLYALEPIRHAWTGSSIEGEFQALDYFVQYASKLDLDGTAEIRLRPHPSDPPRKYNSWLTQHANWNIRIDMEANLAQSIAWADTVVGCETYVLVVALAAGRQVVSTLPPYAPRCRLPMKEIIHLRDLISPNISC